MLIIPAIDLKDGQCVRLKQGLMDDATVFSNSPGEQAAHWLEQGARRLHVVDLNGAFAGKQKNERAIKEIVDALGDEIPIQLGGGIRSLEAISRALALGVERVILGTVAVEQPELVKEACHKHAQALIVSIDSREGRVATRGWIQGTQLQAVDLALEMVKLGVKRFIHTEISRDGTLSGPNYDILTELIEAVRLPVIAAGGVSSLEHLQGLRRIGVEGAIIGKALYTGDIDLKQALAAAQA